jgi:UDP-N-acetylglucosamine diphosphorylase/glucosamine-1-phosphate N-acetyltransferase
VSELFLYDDKAARGFEPFSLTRPTSELRAGALLLRERWERALGLRASAVVTSGHLSDFDEPWGTAIARGVIPAGSVLANSRCAPSLRSVAAGDSWRCQNKVAAVALSRDVDVAELEDGTVSLDSLAAPKGGRAIEIGGRWVERVWDLVAHLTPMLMEDIPALGVGAPRTGSALGIVGGSHEVYAEDGATVEPQVYFDTTAGPILLRQGCTVQAFTRLVGPLVVGRDSLAGGDKIAGSSIGEVCKVHGELSATILLGHSNKGHDGYVGHSYLGRWVNLGASTITSNLKNTYSTVELWTPDGEKDSELQFLGTFFGDHTKTGIGTLLNTGTVIGAGAQIYGGAVTPKVIPPFAWGERPPYSTYRLEKFIDVVRRVMARRHVELSDRQIRLLTAAYERRWGAERGDAKR